ncbi:hypothetical protein [Paenibacillus thermotolerans]|uniref:hypothetical protein n=1 Tax=Paenibacillus thermotolerans TaxID=3027807 RepID=UPI0023685963|nr:MULTISPECIES: hypothetical protein [unclassified Paenibacillus]
MNRKPRLTKPIVYRNRKFGFAIVIPRWWKSYTVVDRKIYGKPQERFLSFRFRYKGKIYDPIFTIDISKLTGNAWERYFKDSPVTFLCQYKGLTYGYLLPEELPDAFLKPDKQDYDYAKYGRPIRILKKLVAEAPKVLKTLHFIDGAKCHCKPSRCRRLSRKGRRK